MPGPRNIKKKKKVQTKKPRKSGSSVSSRPSLDGTCSIAAYQSSQRSSASPPARQPPIVKEISRPSSGKPDGLIPQTPYIHDPGNGPRVRDTRAFLTSFFAQPPALKDPLCAEFAQEEVCQMLCTVLPEETALILWYNKSRATGRICPACQRLYRLGDVLMDHMRDEHECADEPQPPQLLREQAISGLCSPVCFILASFNYPGAIKSTWGCTADEMSVDTWDLLNSPGEGHGDKGLGMLLKMTRLEDLGLAQLCLPDVDFDSGYDSDPTHSYTKIRAPENRTHLERAYTS